MFSFTRSQRRTTAFSLLVLFVGALLMAGACAVWCGPSHRGAMGYMVVLSEDAKQYLHVHPQEQADKGPVVAFQTQFEQAGRYRVFLQFNHAGKVQTADFVLNVAPATDAAATAKPAGKAAYLCPMGCEGSASDKPSECPMCGMALEKAAS